MDRTIQILPKYITFNVTSPLSESIKLKLTGLEALGALQNKNRHGVGPHNIYFL